MKRLFIYTMALMLTVFACSAKAGIGWQDDFDPIKATWDQVSASWTDNAGSTATLTENNASESYGVATSETITLDVDSYSEIVIVTTEVDANALYSVQIVNANDGNEYEDAVSFMGSAGTQIVNIKELMGWSGTKSFVVNVYIEGEGLSATFDSIQIREPEDIGWQDDFNPIKSTWSDDYAVWTDNGNSTATLQENDPCVSYGCSTSEVITVDVDEYNELVIVSTAIDVNSDYSVQIYEIGTGVYADAVSNVANPGTQVINIADLMNWSGTKQFVIKVWIGGESDTSTFDLIQLRKSSEDGSAWLEEFNPIKVTWDEDTCYWTDDAGVGATLTENNPSESYGAARSEVITVDVNVYNEIYVKATDTGTSCLYSVQIEEVGGDGDYIDVVSYMNVPCVSIADFAQRLGWSGVKSFRVVIWLEGEGDTTTFEKIEIRNGEKLPEYLFWQDHFDPVKETWIEISYPHAYWTNNPNSTATLFEDNNWGDHGKIESETFDVNVSVYDEVTLVVTDIDDGAWLDVQIQEQEGMYSSANVIANANAVGTYQGSISSTMGWTGGEHLFRMVLWINGEGKSITLDQLKLSMDCGVDALLGDYNEDCQVDLLDIAAIGLSWMTDYDMLDMADISDNWLEKTY